MCSPGHHIESPCTKFTSTMCLPCPGSTYSAKPNNRSVCSKCTLCNTVNVLRVKANCTQTSDTVCEPLEGFYCTDGYSGSCRYAVEHTKCSPGQYIKQKEETEPQSSQCASSTSPLKYIQETESPAVQADCNKEHTVQVKT
ncbi:hypothetical protein Q7C36_012875 [Tachysurus vachellii]|uniref:TNFR-Cys domain-containing protein n=1 Tax=Tachysurus vachellii TaxID=175792 RepID=A0AA88MRS6_TACVA|nr:hypothetical protein Q7C36_012875 [Tachysurus vachellii]